MARVLIVKSINMKMWPLEITLPLGPLYLASYLRAAGHQVKVLDLRLSRGLGDSQMESVKEFAPDVLGLSALTVESAELHRAAERIRREVPSCRKVAVGGPYGTSSPERALADENVDAAVAGEGEAAFLHLVRAWEAGKGASGIPGVHYREGGKILSGGSPDTSADANSYPFPAWDLLHFDDYARAPRMCNLKPGRYAPIFTSRSCPYHCVFCHNVFGKGFRPRSPENVLEEMELLVTKRNVREFEISDDIFNLDRERTLAICEGIASRGWDLRIAFPNGLRADLLDETVLTAMKRAGVYFMALAVESASPRLQKAIRKNLDLDRASRAMEIARKLGITTFGFFMLGFPTETEEEMWQTIRFARDSKLNLAAFFTVTAHEGTELWNMVEGTDLDLPVGDGAWHYGRFRGNLSRLSDKHFARIKRQAYMHFYGHRPQRVLFCRTLGRVSLLYVPQAFLRKAVVGR
ncbi:MAG: radical SAM protein [Thermodesulfobacteriota bacterium]